MKEKKSLYRLRNVILEERAKKISVSVQIVQRGGDEILPLEEHRLQKKRSLPTIILVIVALSDVFVLLRV